MPPVLPFDIIALIIDIVGENKDTNLLKELSLVSHYFFQNCSKHLFATVELHDAYPKHHIASSKKGFVKLLESRPDVVKYIRKLTYKMENNDRFKFLQFMPSYPTSFDDNDDDLLSPILPNFLRTIPRLTCLKINASASDWYSLNFSLTSALLHLMHLPTINHIDLSYIKNFPLSSLTSSVNLHRLDMLCLMTFKSFDQHGEDYSFEIVQSEMTPKIREFYTAGSDTLTTKLLHGKRQDGRPAFNFMDLRRLSMSFTRFEDERNIRYLLQNAKLLEKLHLSVDIRRSLVGLLSPTGIARTLKILDLKVFLYHHFSAPPLGGLCEELEAMAGHNILETLSFDVSVDVRDTEDSIGSVIQNVEKVLVKPGWTALRQVSFKVSIAWYVVPREYGVKFSEKLQSIPDKYLSHLSQLESVALNYSTCLL